MRRFVVVAVVAALALVGLAPSSRAAVVDAPLESGVPFALSLAAGDGATFTVPTPAATAQTLTATGVTPGLRLQLTYTGATGPLAVDGDDPSTWFVELGQNGGDASEQFLLVQVASATGGDVTLTLTNAPVVEVRAPVGVDVPVRVDIPGQDVRVTFDAGGDDRATLSLRDVVLGDPLDGSTAARFTVTTPDFPFDGGPGPETPEQQYGPARVQRDGDSSFFVDLAGGRTGTFTVHVDLEYAPGPEFTYRADAQPVTLDTPTRVRQIHFTATGFAPTGVEIFLPRLTSGTGGTGSLEVQLVEPGSPPVTLGTVTDAPATFSTPGPLTQLADTTLRFVGDGATTGSVFVRLVLAPVPGGTFTAGSTPLELPAGAGARAWTVDLAEGDDYELHLRDVTFGDPENLGTVRAEVLGPNGQRQQSADLTTFSTEEQLGISAFIAGRYTVELSWDGPTDFAVTTTLVAVRRTVRTVSATAPADVPVDLTTPGETLAVELPVRAGHRLALRLVDQVWSGPPDRFGNPPSASLSASSDVLGFDALSSDDNGLSENGDTYRQTLDAPADGTVTVRIAVGGLVTGTARLLVTEPVDTTGRLGAAGTTTTIPVDALGSVADYAFDVAGPGQVALDIAAPELALADGPGGLARVTLVGPDGSIAPNTMFTGGDRLWLDFGVRGASGLPEPAPGTYHLRFDPLADATGTIAVTRVAPAVTTTAVRTGRTTTVTYAPGDLRRLTFTGRAGQRPVLRLGGDRLDVALVLVGPDGLAVRTFQSFEYGNGYAEFDPLPTSGAWSVLLDPDTSTSGTQTVRLDLARDPVRTVEPGRLVTATWAVGENPVYRFRVRKGQHVAVDVRTAQLDDAEPGSGLASLALFGAGTGDFPVAQASLGQGAAPTPLWVEPGEIGFTAPQDGVWELRLDPFRAATGRVTFVVRTATDQVVAGRLGRTTTVRVDAPVQNVTLPFDVTGPATGGLLRWSVTDSTFAGARLELFTPFGTLWEIVDVPPGTSSGTFFAGVGFAGTWRLVLDPTDGSTGRARMFFGLTGA